MLQNARVAAFIVSELLRENHQGRGGGGGGGGKNYPPLPPPPRLGLNGANSLNIRSQTWQRSQAQF